MLHLIFLESAIDKYGRLLFDWLTQSMCYRVVSLVIGIVVVLIFKISTGCEEYRDQRQCT